MKKLSFSKLKPSYIVRVESSKGDFEARILSKHNGTKTLTLLRDNGEVHEGVPYGAILGRPDPDPFDQIHPMLAKSVSSYKTLNKDDLLADDNWWLEEKYDGERQILLLDPFNGYRATTRVVGKNTGVLAENTGKLMHIFRDITGSLPAGGPTVFDVELMHKEGFRTLRSIMGSDNERAQHLQEVNGPVHAVVFDVLWFNGEDLRDVPFKHRRAVLEEWYYQTYFEAHTSGGAIDRRVYLDLSILATTEENKRRMLDEILAAGGEGAMLKHVDGKYTDTTVPKRRSKDLLKIKPFEEDDVVIYGFEMGKGEYNQHKFGAINFGQWVRAEDVSPEMDKNVLLGISAEFDRPSDLTVFVHMGSCSGITDEQEAAFRSNPEMFIGMTMEVKFQSRWPDTGLMRHPNFMRLRDDKPASECIYVPGE